jgi:hypothetical protein
MPVVWVLQAQTTITDAYSFRRPRNNVDLVLCFVV